MYDYRLLEALVAVWDQGGFERAADFLGLTQSAVSQRIRSLEESEGQILISRTLPPEPTGRGRELIRLSRKVSLLEGDLGSGENARTLRVGVNADSLATWFLEAAEPYLAGGRRFLDLRVDDQDRTREMLRRGEVAGCVGSESRPLQGCAADCLGTMEYALVCTPSFGEEWFPRGFTAEAAGRAPAVVFNREDRLHERFLGRLFLGFSFPGPVHYIPSSEQFLNMILRNRAFGALPLMQCSPYLEGDLRELADFRIPVDLYWHRWSMNSGDLADLTACLKESCRSLLY